MKSIPILILMCLVNPFLSLTSIFYFLICRQSMAHGIITTLRVMLDNVIGQISCTHGANSAQFVFHGAVLSCGSVGYSLVD